MSITKDQLLERVGAYYEDVFHHLDYPEKEEDRSDFFEQKMAYKNVSDKLSEMIETQTSLSSDWIAHNDLRNEVSDRYREAHFEMGVENTIDYVLKLYNLQSDDPDITIAYAEIMRKMKKGYFDPYFDAGAAAAKRSKEYRDIEDTFMERDKVFEDTLSEYPEILEYYQFTYAEAKNYLDVIECEDFYFAGCRIALHVLLEEILRKAMNAK